MFIQFNFKMDMYLNILNILGVFGYFQKKNSYFYVEKDYILIKLCFKVYELKFY